MKTVIFFKTMYIVICQSPTSQYDIMNPFVGFDIKRQPFFAFDTKTDGRQNIENKNPMGWKMVDNPPSSSHLRV